MIGAPKNMFVPKRKADDSLLSLPKDKRREHFRAAFRGLLDGATTTVLSPGPPSSTGSNNEPEKKE